MGYRIGSALACVAALAAFMAPSSAHAERVYFLVGVRHVYKIGFDPDAHLAEREDIEKTYADGVASDQQTFQQHIDGGADKDQESTLLNQDLDKLADDRDQQLGAIFELRDDIRDRHPELHIDEDGPYQVMGIDFHPHPQPEDPEVFDDIVVLAPWPGYVVVGEPYCGWVFGVVYQPTVFVSVYTGWHAHYGGPAYVPAYYGHRGPVHFAPRGFVRHFGPARAVPGRGVAPDRYGRPVVRPGGYGHPVDPARPGAPIRPGGGYGHPVDPARPGEPARPGGGYGHPVDPIRPGEPVRPGGGYGHPVDPARPGEPIRPGGGYGHPVDPARPGEPVRPGGGYGHPVDPIRPGEPVRPGGGYGHPVDPIRPNPLGPGAYGHPVDPARPNPTAPGGYGHGPERPPVDSRPGAGYGHPGGLLPPKGPGPAQPLNTSHTVGYASTAQNRYGSTTTPSRSTYGRSTTSSSSYRSNSTNRSFSSSSSNRSSSRSSWSGGSGRTASHDDEGEGGGGRSSGSRSSGGGSSSSSSSRSSSSSSHPASSSSSSTTKKKN